MYKIDSIIENCLCDFFRILNGEFATCMLFFFILKDDAIQIYRWSDLCPWVVLSKRPKFKITEGVKENIKHPPIVFPLQPHRHTKQINTIDLDE